MGVKEFFRPNWIKLVLGGFWFVVIAYLVFVFSSWYRDMWGNIFIHFIVTFFLASFLITIRSIISKREKTFLELVFEGYTSFFIGAFHFFLSWLVFFLPDISRTIWEIQDLLIKLIGKHFLLFNILIIPFLGCILEYYIYKKTKNAIWKYALIFSIMFFAITLLLMFLVPQKVY